MQGGGRLSARSASSQPFTAWSSTVGLQNHIPTISCVSLLHLSSHPSHTSLFARPEASSSLFGRRQASKKKAYTPPPSRRSSPQAQPSRTPPSPPETPAQQPQQATQAPAQSEEQATQSPATPTPEPLPAAHSVSPSTVPSSKRSVLIAGATVPGLTLGLLLRSSGINVDINDAEEAKVIGVTVLNVNARRILDRLGLTPALSRAGYEIFRHQEEAQQNYIVKDITYRNITSNILGSDKKPLLPLAIQTSSLINILTNAFTKPESGVGKSVLQAGPIHSMQKGANGNTMVSFSGAAASGREYSLVVGTDTPLSKNALPGFKDEVYMKKAKVIRSLYGLWSIVIERPVTDFKEFNTSVDIRAPGNRFGIIPLSKSHIYVWATASPRGGGHVLAFRAGQRDIREFPQAEIFKGFQTHSVPNILQTIQDMDGSCYVTYPRIQTLEKWYNNGPEGTSNVLISQAAYRLPPYPMHDSSMGIEDAFLLAKRLAGNDETPMESLLASFQEVRKPQVEKVQKAARALEAETQISNKLWWYAKNGVIQLTTSQLSNWNEKRLLNRVGREL